MEVLDCVQEYKHIFCHVNRRNWNSAKVSLVLLAGLAVCLFQAYVTPHETLSPKHSCKLFMSMLRKAKPTSASYVGIMEKENGNYYNGVI